MAGTSSIAVDYSSYLDKMTDFVRSYAANALSDEEKWRLSVGLKDFCFNNSKKFSKEFYSRVGLDLGFTARRPEGIDGANSWKNRFVKTLASKGGECIFLLRDTFEVMEMYQKNTGRGFGVLVNREFLCENGNEEDYFELINLLYSSLDEIKNNKDFLNKYFEKFTKLIKESPHFEKKAREIFHYVSSRYTRPIIWVDIGFQYTFSLFCYASVRYFGGKSYKQDIYSFSVYPWLNAVFSGKYFTERNDLVLDMELRSIALFEDSMRHRAMGAVVGFGIGDALGFPVAGMEESDCLAAGKCPITGFTDNTGHPMFYDLKPGNYTENTRLFILTAEHLIKNGGFRPVAYSAELAEWASGLAKKGLVYGRWAGPTAYEAAIKLSKGISYLNSGSTTTQSCSGTYRALPFGIFYSQLGPNNLDDFARTVSELTGITHNSTESKLGGVIAAIIIGDLLLGALPNTAVLGALHEVQKMPGGETLKKRVKSVLMNYAKMSPEEVRKMFGTGASVLATLPLSIYYLLKFSDDFTNGVLAAANSIRKDTHKEKIRIMELSWEQQLLEVDGGNSDGIAAITGAFLGARLGDSGIPTEFDRLESREILMRFGRLLVK